MLRVAICLLQTMFASSASVPGSRKRYRDAIPPSLAREEPFEEPGEWVEHTVILAAIHCSS